MYAVIQAKGFFEGYLFVDSKNKYNFSKELGVYRIVMIY